MAVLKADPNEARPNGVNPYANIVMRAIAGDGNIEAGMVVVIDNRATTHPDPTVLRGIATDADGTEGVFGIVVVGGNVPHSGAGIAIPTGGIMDVITRGPVHGFDGLEVGKTYYVSGTFGNIGRLSDLVSTNYIARVGVALTEEILYVDPMYKDGDQVP
jgi:hypothetical protein